MFNWYFAHGQLHGDVCLTQMRHEEYVQEKRCGVPAKMIAKRDRHFKQNTPGVLDRFCVFTSRRPLMYDPDQAVVTCVGDQAYRLINMDSFFASDQHPERKAAQICALAQLKN